MWPLRTEGKQTCSRQLSSGKRTSKLSGLSSERQPEQTPCEGFVKVEGLLADRRASWSQLGVLPFAQWKHFSILQAAVVVRDGEICYKVASEQHKTYEMIISP